jgi:hypothetical protein
MQHPTRKSKRNSGALKRVALISDALHRRLNSYAVAAGAAGVAMLACSPAAEAALVCRNLSIAFISNNTFPLTVQDQAFAPFQVAQTGSNYFSSSYGRFFSWNRAFLTPNSGGANVLLGSGGLAANLAAGASIGPAAQFGKPGSYGMLFTYGKGFRFVAKGGSLLKHRGNFDLQKSNYVGFEFSQAGAVHYGWVRLAVSFKSSYKQHKNTILHILGYGYESSPNTAIAAGSCTVTSAERPFASSDDNTHADVGKPGAVGGPGAALGMLALGRDGLSMWRK